jgi:hypothetical protein
MTIATKLCENRFLVIISGKGAGMSTVWISPQKRMPLLATITVKYDAVFQDFGAAPSAGDIYSYCCR